MYRKSSGEEQTRIRRGPAKKESLSLNEKTEVVMEGNKSLSESAGAIKECPVCHARCFADMEVCYGCLHSFKKDTEKGARQSSNKRILPSGVVARRLSPENDKGVLRLNEKTLASMKGDEEFRSTEGSLLDGEAQAIGIVQPNEKVHFQATTQLAEEVQSAEKKKVKERVQRTPGSELLEIVISVRVPSGIEVNGFR